MYELQPSEPGESLSYGVWVALMLFMSALLGVSIAWTMYY